MNKKDKFEGSVFRYRLKLTKVQSDTIDRWMKVGRWLYNKVLDYRIQDYKYASDNFNKYYNQYPYLFERMLHDPEFMRYRKHYLMIKDRERKNHKDEGVWRDLTETELDEVNTAFNKIKTFKPEKNSVPYEFYKHGAPITNQGGGDTSDYKYYAELKETAPPYIIDDLNEMSAVSGQEILARVDSAYKSFFSGGGFPKFRREVNSVTWTSTTKFKGGIINIPKFGALKFIKHAHKHNELPEVGVCKRVNITKTNTNKYFINILYAHHIEPRAHTEKIIGFDRNIRLDQKDDEERRNYATGYDGEKFIYIKQPTFYRDEKEKLKKIQQKQSRLRLGSVEWKRAQHIINKIQEHINNRKNDWIHNRTREIADTYKIVGLEDLSIKELTNKEKGKCKASKKKTVSQENAVLTQEKAIRRGFNETAHYKFAAALAYKLKWNGGETIKVPSAYTSMKCSTCSEINYALTLSDEKWTCAKCNTTHNRDENAAINIYRDTLTILSSRESI